jgi:oligoendopeptidase F
VDFDRIYEYDDIIDWVVTSVQPLGKEYQKMIRGVFGNRWIDVDENEGKYNGAFSAGVYSVHPYLLLNYNETLESVFTTAHEVGHTMHTMLSQENQPFATSDYTIFVAEVASTLNEALMLDYMFEHAKDPQERITLLQQAIDNIVGTFYTQVMFADYEWQAHKLVEQGRPITAEVLSELYTGLLKEYYGDTLSLEGDLYGSTWARISHFYGSPFYVYKYATCFASSAILVKEITSKDKKVSKAALDRYLTLLKSGGNDYPMEQLKKAGVDLTQPATFQAVIDQLDDLVTRLEKELENL